VMGNLEGEFELQGELVIAPSAVVRGEVKAVTVTVSGSLSGTLTAREKIHLEKSAVVSGRLHTLGCRWWMGPALTAKSKCRNQTESSPPLKGTSRNDEPGEPVGVRVPPIRPMILNVYIGTAVPIWTECPLSGSWRSTDGRGCVPGTLRIIESFDGELKARTSGFAFWNGECRTEGETSSLTSTTIQGE